VNKCDLVLRSVFVPATTTGFHEGHVVLGSSSAVCSTAAPWTRPRTACVNEASQGSSLFNAKRRPLEGAQDEFDGLRRVAPEPFRWWLEVDRPSSPLAFRRLRTRAHGLLCHHAGLRGYKAYVLACSLRARLPISLLPTTKSYAATVSVTCCVASSYGHVVATRTFEDTRWLTEWSGSSWPRFLLPVSSRLCGWSRFSSLVMPQAYPWSTPRR